MATGAELIRLERERQLEEEGYSAEHDDLHINGELPIAAAQLLVEGTDAVLRSPYDNPDMWGLVEKHRGTLNQLVVAGALVAAEIDRRLRAKMREHKGQTGQS